ALLPVLAALAGACGDDGSYAGSAGAGADYGEPPQEEAPPRPDDAADGESQTCDETKPVTLFLSPDDSNSTSSPVQVRESILSGGELAYAPIRTWEFLNYYSFSYPTAEPGMVTVTPELARTEGMPEGQYLLQIGVASESVPAADRLPMNITLVLDESGSMNGHPLEMEREVCLQIAGSLRAGDIVSLVGWDT